MITPIPAPAIRLFLVSTVALLGADALVWAADIPADPKTLAGAIGQAKAGDTILLADGDYSAVAIGQRHDPPLTLRPAQGARPQMVAGLAIRQAAGVCLSGLTFTWPAGGRPTRGMTPFLTIADSRHVEVADCEFFDDPKLDRWSGWVCNISNSQQVLIRDTKAHHFYFGFSALSSKDVTFRNLVIGPWSHEDGIRVTCCDGPILIDGCRISNAGNGKRTTGHPDGIQLLDWSDGVTIRNCRIHGVSQAIGAFGVSGRRRKDWRVEGNLVYDVDTSHVCTVTYTDGVVVVNNTFPQGRPILGQCTNAILKNNIISGALAKDPAIEADYNLFIGGMQKLGDHDLVNTDPKFVNAPLLTLWSESGKVQGMTRSKLFFRGTVARKISVGDQVEVMNTDGTGRDGQLRKVIAAGDNWLQIDPPLADPPGVGGVFVYKWPTGQTNLVRDYHLKPDSPAIDSADSSVNRSRDMDGHEPTDTPGVSNTGAGRVQYLDRGAFEFVPAR